jgi:chromosome partitioning protein
VRKHPRPTKVVTLAASKGGVGKTTIATALAVRAAKDSNRVALLDLDPQESMSAWWERRGKPANPKLFEIDATAEAIELLMSEGWEWVFVDTPPARIELIEPGIVAADLVLIPCRPSALDIEQIDIAIELCETHEKSFAFILNHAPSNWKLTKTSKIFLAKGGRTVLEHSLTFRQAYMAAMTVGKSGPEVESDGRAHEEINQLWDATRAVLAKLKKVQG